LGKLRVADASLLLIERMIGLGRTAKDRHFSPGGSYKNPCDLETGVLFYEPSCLSAAGGARTAGRMSAHRDKSGVVIVVHKRRGVFRGDSRREILDSASPALEHGRRGLAASEYRRSSSSACQLGSPGPTIVQLGEVEPQGQEIDESRQRLRRAQTQTGLNCSRSSSSRWWTRDGPAVRPVGGLTTGGPGRRARTTARDLVHTQL
jgi:hypothetical protein